MRCFITPVFEDELRLLLDELLKNLVRFRKSCTFAAIGIEGTAIQANACRMLKEKDRSAGRLRISVGEESIVFRRSKPNKSSVCSAA